MRRKPSLSTHYSDKPLVGVGPVEGMGHRWVVVADEVGELIAEFWHRCEAAAAQAFSMNDAEDDLNLVEPRTVFREVDEPKAMARIGEGFTTTGWRLQDACHFFPSAPLKPHFSAIHSTRLADWCGLRLSITKSHSAVSSICTVLLIFTVRAMCSTNFGSVRVASKVGDTI